MTSLYGLFVEMCFPGGWYTRPLLSSWGRRWVPVFSCWGGLSCVLGRKLPPPSLTLLQN